MDELKQKIKELTENGKLKWAWGYWGRVVPLKYGYVAKYDNYYLTITKDGRCVYYEELVDIPPIYLFESESLYTLAFKSYTQQQENKTKEKLQPFIDKIMSE